MFLLYRYVEVSFYNVARSLTIVFNVVLTFFLLGESTSFNTLACLVAVILGFFVGSVGEVRFSFIGTVFGVISSLFVSLNSIYTKKVMGLVDNNQWKLSAYNNINACILFIPLIIGTGELDIIRKESHLLFSFSFWFIMVIGGIFGFLIGIVTIMQIKLTSPLTHNISGTAKACVQTVLAFMIWKNPTTAENILGIFLVLFGSMAYTYVRTQEMAAANTSPNKAGNSNGNNERSAMAKDVESGKDSGKDEK